MAIGFQGCPPDISIPLYHLFLTGISLPPILNTFRDGLQTKDPKERIFLLLNFENSLYILDALP